MNYSQVLDELHACQGAVAFRPTFKGTYLKLAVDGTVLVCDKKSCVLYESTVNDAKSNDWLITRKKTRNFIE